MKLALLFVFVCNFLTLQVDGAKTSQSTKAQTNPTIINYGNGDVVVSTNAATTSKMGVNNNKYGGGRGGSGSDVGDFPTANVGDQFSPAFLQTVVAAIGSSGGGKVELGGDVVNQMSHASTYVIGQGATNGSKPPDVATAKDDDIPPQQDTDEAADDDDEGEAAKDDDDIPPPQDSDEAADVDEGVAAEDNDGDDQQPPPEDDDVDQSNPDDVEAEG